MKNVKKAVEIAECKYPSNKYNILWVLYNCISEGKSYMYAGEDIQHRRVTERNSQKHSMLSTVVAFQLYYTMLFFIYTWILTDGPPM